MHCLQIPMCTKQLCLFCIPTLYRSMEISRGLKATSEYLTTLQKSASGSTYDRVKSQQLTAWKERLDRETFTPDDAGLVIAAVTNSSWDQRDKDELLEKVAFIPETSGSGKKLRPRQDLKDFASFLRQSDVAVLRDQSLSMVSKMDKVGDILCSLHVHIPTEKTMGHVLENLNLSSPKP